MSESSFILILLFSIFVVGYVYQHLLRVTFENKDPTFAWNYLVHGVIIEHPRRNEIDEWEFFFLSTIHMLICILIVVTILYVIQGASLNE